MGCALLMIDVQNDFCPGGRLAVPEGDRVAPVLNTYAELFAAQGLPVFASRDWHPAATSHFADFGGVWPRHCIQNTEGAAFHPKLCLPAGTVILSKGMDPQRDDYSAFCAVTPDGTRFADRLVQMGVETLFAGGLATDYCVKETVLEGLTLGFTMVLLNDAIRGVDVAPGDSELAIAAMTAAGARLTTLEKITTDISSCI